MELYSHHPREDQDQEEVVMADNNNKNSSTSKQSSSSFSSSLSPCSSSSHYRNVLVHHHHQQQQQNHEQLPASNFLSGIISSNSSEFIEKEDLFDKVVTPSDVGKLNRLVIPKQHAEKYFPLDSAANEKGLLLNFEDTTSGKPWRFRYSYWNSSQSYVMTKGWTRFVKDKKLVAGDVVSFQRGAADRFYIDWRRRRPDLHHSKFPLTFPTTVIPWGGHGRLFFPAVSSSTRDHLQLNYDDHHQQQLQQRLSSSTGITSYGNYYSNNNNEAGPAGSSVVYLRSSSSSPITTRRIISEHDQVGLMQQQYGDNMAMVFDSVPVVHGQAAAKRVRLFGVNLECPDDNECVVDILSSTTISGSSIHAHDPIDSAPPPPPELQLSFYNGSPLPTELLPKRGRPSLSLDLL